MKDVLRNLMSALFASAGAAPTWTAAGIISLLGLAGPAVALMVADWLLPVLIGLSILLLGRSFYILYVQRRGNRASMIITWLAALFVVGYWTWRLGGGEWFMACVS